MWIRTGSLQSFLRPFSWMEVLNCTVWRCQAPFMSCQVSKEVLCMHVHRCPWASGNAKPRYITMGHCFMHPNSQATGLCVTLVWWGFCTPSPTKCHENNKFPRRDLQMNLLSSLAIKMYSVKSIHLCDPQNRRCIEANRSLYIWQHRTSRETHTAVASKAIKDRSKHNSQGINTWCKLHGMALRCVGLCELCGGNLRPMQIQRTRRSGGKMLDQKTKKTKQTVPVPFRKRNILSKLLFSYPTEDILILQARHVSWSHVLSRFSLHTAFQHSVPHLWR